MKFIDLNRQNKLIRKRIGSNLLALFKRGDYILGKEVKELEEKLCEFVKAKFCITCANGTEALKLALLSENLRYGDGVLIPNFSFISTIEAPTILGLRPILVDVNKKSYNIDIQSLLNTIDIAKKQRIKPRVLISVDLFGNPCDYSKIYKICKKENIVLIIDSAQSFGSKFKKKYIGAFGDYCCTSFFPSKPLGCYGDGGAIFCQDKKKFKNLVSLRSHGKGENKYNNVLIGLNSRLDTLQAIILLEKLRIFKHELILRNKIAERYITELSGLTKIKLPMIDKENQSNWAQFTITATNRDKLKNYLGKNNIPSMVYYPIPLSKQKAYKKFNLKGQRLQSSIFLTKNVLSLPMHPYLTVNQQNKIIKYIKGFYKNYS